MQKKLNLKNPQGFNEKLQWLKLYDRRTLFTQLVDKYEVRKYISDTAGEQYVVPLLGVWNHFEEIDFDALPDQFVLKCNHDSGSTIVCKNKQQFDIYKAGERINERLARNHFLLGREWPYKNIKRKVIAEVYLEDASGTLRDYKFYCFNGKAKMIYFSEGLSDLSTAKYAVLTTDWKKLMNPGFGHVEIEELPEKPEKLDKMVVVAEKLSSVAHFLRVDFYEVNGQVMISELTFYPYTGMMKFVGDNDDEMLGSWLELPETLTRI